MSIEILFALTGLSNETIHAPVWEFSRRVFLLLDTTILICETKNGHAPLVSQRGVFAA